ncbi:hypothetical protein [Actinomyces marmotae]|uniref:hypothetical protein n=1 Tax=Actinomyces marmotae TaxID=2737173 RepID=UPI00135CD0A7|nr:hypothetical protein [Actinomyces marmotae]
MAAFSPKPSLSAMTGEVGRRLRLSREEPDLSQDKLAERRACHPIVALATDIVTAISLNTEPAIISNIRRVRIELM